MKNSEDPVIIDAQELLDNCAREPIHRPGRIQSHGLLLVLDPNGGTILCASENVTEHLGIELEDVLGATLTSLAPEGLPAMGQILKSFLESADLALSRSPVPMEMKLAGGRALNVFAVQGGDGYHILEFELAPPTPQSDVQAHLLSAYAKFRMPQLDIAQVLGHAAREVKEATGFGRVMIYKFHQDWHGEVVAEACGPDLHPLMGLHFPASDIPPQARELYTRNLTRLIADPHAPTIGLRTLKGHEALAAMDLSNVETRAVSPVHIQYLKNMGVGASFSISILSQGRLWGLIACHSTSAAMISPSVRTTCLLIGQLLAVSLEADQERLNNQVNLQAEQALHELALELRKEKDLNKVLAENAGALLKFFNADGLWSNIGGRITSVGIAPGDLPLTTMMGSMDQGAESSVIAVERMADVLGTANDQSADLSGYLGIRLQRSTQEYIFLLRREKIQKVTWAGAAKKSDKRFEQNGLGTLGPRASFDRWEEEVQGISEKWTPLDLSMGRKLRTLMLDALNMRTAQIRDLNEKLKHAYEEMEAFSYSISHDLRVPLSSIANYAEMIIEELGISPTEEVLELVRGVSRGTTRMSQLIDHVLEHARLGKVALRKQWMPMLPVIKEIQGDLVMKYIGHSPPHILVIGNTPPILSDPIMVGQVFGNLISNAFKYTLHVDSPIISVSGAETVDLTTYTITDNGIGIDMEHKESIFQLFQRSDNVGEYEGSGVGLAIVKRVVERHGGQISFTSVLGSGSSFKVSFPKS